MQRKHRITAVILTVLISISITASYSYVIENVHHDCTKENCSVCMQISEALHFIASVKFIPVYGLFTLLIGILIYHVAGLKRSTCINRTLVSMKVELLN